MKTLRWCLVVGVVLSLMALIPSPITLAGAAAAQATVYVCPMHPDVRGNAGDACPRCGMKLVPLVTDYTPYDVDVEVTPRAIRAGTTVHLRLIVRRPGTGAVVDNFEKVHDRILHLFVISQDLQTFAHIHPVLQPDGALETDVTIPKPGIYDVIADFVPAGGAPQLAQRVIVTADYTGNFAAVPDLRSDLGDKIDSGVMVQMRPPDRRATREQLVTFTLRDATTRAPVTDLQPYLGALGHLLIVSADTSVVFHSHAVDAISSPAGPTVVFQVLFPRPGMYRLWAQFQRNSHVVTVPFTVVIDNG